MDLHEALAKLTRHPIFVDWKKTHEDYYLAHGFKMIGDKEWQIGWYNPETQKVKTFIVGDNIEQTEEQGMLKEGTIKKLEPEKVKITEEEALKAMEDVKMPVLKKFYIIQNLDGKTIYNITYFTQAYDTINVHVEAGTGEELERTKQKLMDFA